jgi:hypothetical protein
MAQMVSVVVVMVVVVVQQLARVAVELLLLKLL